MLVFVGLWLIAALGVMFLISLRIQRPDDTRGLQSVLYLVTAGSIAGAAAKWVPRNRPFDEWLVAVVVTAFALFAGAFLLLVLISAVFVRTRAMRPAWEPVGYGEDLPEALVAVCAEVEALGFVAVGTLRAKTTYVTLLCRDDLPIVVEAVWSHREGEADDVTYVAYTSFITSKEWEVATVSWAATVFLRGDQVFQTFPDCPPRELLSHHLSALRFLREAGLSPMSWPRHQLIDRWIKHSQAISTNLARTTTAERAEDYRRARAGEHAHVMPLMENQSMLERLDKLVMSLPAPELEQLARVRELHNASLDPGEGLAYEGVHI